MHTRQLRQRFTAVLGTLIVLGLLGYPATAQDSPHHTWGNYHWAAKDIKIGNNLSGVWNNGVFPEQRGYLAETVKDWNDPAYGTRLGELGERWPTPVITLGVAQGSASRAKTCKPVAGRIEVCNYTYGKNKWLGITQIWTSGDHITQATSKLNDTYYADPRSGYSTVAERLSVICHELAHGFGLDHWDEDHDNVNTGSCMDYSNHAAGGQINGRGFNYGPSDEHPHYLDFQDLEWLYGSYHSSEQSSTSSSSIGAATTAEAEVADDPSEWGEVIKRDDKGRPHLYRKNLGEGKKLFTFVTHADETRGPQTDVGQTNDGTANTGTADDGKKDDGKKHKKNSKRKGQRDRRHR
jgi:hypothetical protein